MKKIFLISFITAIFICSPAHASSGDMKLAYQAADVLTFDGSQGGVSESSLYTGAATLFRKKNELKANIMSLVPNPGVPVTAWFIIFNKPNKCDDETVVKGPDGEVLTKCALSDISNPDTQTAVYYAGSAISTDDGMGNGVVNIHAKTVAGKIPEGIHINKGLGKNSDVGLKRGHGFKADVHIALAIHDLPMETMLGDTSWITDLTTDHDDLDPMGNPLPPIRAAIFVPAK